MRNPENSAGAVFVRLGGELYDRLEDFRRRQAKIPHRSEALRSLIERALTASDSAAGDEPARPSPSEDGS
jgi:metal-responsive CopG/Arc/MetJ family transcriptional regulator